ncbi:hypothetical protein [Paenibacillus luteus]|uniref:hypothetical protein n=1 Tax=Paenibacillus luteus TaxID=2545753 RepID=UPI0011446280|nr:hypothetical protein [Paenibacillus luteus]
MNYGKYEVPPTLKTLIKLEKELDHEGYSIWDVLGFTFEDSHYRYFNTPSDVVVFAVTGGDGIHYGFLTDYGTAVDLENAPVVEVSPMSFDRPAKVVANNLKEFIRIAMLDSSMLYMEYENEEAYLALENELNFPPSDESKQNKAAVVKKLEENLSLPFVDDPYTYSVRAKNERANRIMVATQDGLGVTSPVPATEQNAEPLFYIHADEDLDLEALSEYFKTAYYEHKLAIFRDIQFHYIINEDVEIQAIVAKEMRSMGLVDEAARIYVR